MKAFFEEYGFVMLSAVVVIALICIANGLQGTVQGNIKNVMDGFEKTIVTNGTVNFKIPTTSQ